MKNVFKKAINAFFNTLELKSINSIVVVGFAVCVIMLFVIGSYLIRVNKQNALIPQNPAEVVMQTTNSKAIYVNINTAGADTLTSLPGIGEVLANRIILYRNENGNFCSKECIMEVKGISKKKYEQIKDLIEL